MQLRRFIVSLILVCGVGTTLLLAGEATQSQISRADASTQAAMPEGLDETVTQLIGLLDAGKYEDAVRLCWEPSSLDQMDRLKMFEKVVELVKQDARLRPTLSRVLADGPTKTFANEQGRQYADFDEHKPELTSLRFVRVNGHWYMW